RNEGYRLCRCVPRRLHPPAERRSGIRAGDDALHSPRGMHRLWRLRAGVPGRGDLREYRRNPRAPERPDRGQRGLSSRRHRCDGAGRSERPGARRFPTRDHGDPRCRATGRARKVLKLATWNVNGIRARQAQVQEWIAHERPDVVCLQEIKASSDQIPTALCEMEGYWCYWHGGKGYSGVALQVSQAFAPERPAFFHPTFDYENRIVTVDLATPLGVGTVASGYVPNGGKDFPAKMPFL